MLGKHIYWLAAFGVLLVSLGSPSRTTAAPAPYLYKVDPQATYLRSSPSDSGVRSSVPLALETIGVSPGDWVQLRALGGFSWAAGIPDSTQDTIGVFSSTNVLSDASMTARVPGALAAGIPYVTPSTFFGGFPTDIPQDFNFGGRTGGSVVLQVPAEAKYLFFSVSSSVYGDNTDPNGDYFTEITLVCPPVTSFPLDPPFGTVTSDIGPRSGTTNFFHAGIDYRSAPPGVRNSVVGTPIPAVESGEIQYLGWSDTGGWVVGIRGFTTGQTWWYLHTFSGTSNTVPVTSGKYKLNRLPSGAYYIAKFGDNAAAGPLAIYLAATPSPPPTVEGRAPRTCVGTGERFAPAGKSSAVPNTPPHLHLGLNQYANGSFGKDSPFLYVRTPAATAYPVSVISPREGRPFRAGGRLRISVSVDSTASLDLDRVHVLIDNEEVRPTSEVEPEGRQSATFQYGGALAEDPSSSVGSKQGSPGILVLNGVTNAAKLRVIPTGSNAGIDRFEVDFSQLKGLEPGLHFLSIVVDGITQPGAATVLQPLEVR